MGTVAITATNRVEPRPARPDNDLADRPCATMLTNMPESD